jgi:hypothetical protein
MRVVAFVQVTYFVLTGVWPIVHLRSFEAITGPKVDGWLVRTVGLLVTVIGLAIGVAAWRGVFSPEVMLLAVSSAGSLAVIDVVYVAQRRIAKVYLLDALAEAILILGWGLAYAADAARS